MIEKLIQRLSLIGLLTLKELIMILHIYLGKNCGSEKCSKIFKCEKTGLGRFFYSQIDSIRISAEKLINLIFTVLSKK